MLDPQGLRLTKRILKHAADYLAVHGYPLAPGAGLTLEVRATDRKSEMLVVLSQPNGESLGAFFETNRPPKATESPAPAEREK